VIVTEVDTEGFSKRSSEARRIGKTAF